MKTGEMEYEGGVVGLLIPHHSNTPILHHSLLKEETCQPNIAQTISAACFDPPSSASASANSDTAQLRALEDKHILRVIERQKELGFKIFTDGELAAATS